MKYLLTASKVGVLAFAVTMSVLPATALARPTYDRTVIYFDEFGYTTGIYTINCQGSSNLIGYRTDIFSVTEIPCQSEG